MNLVHLCCRSSPLLPLLITTKHPYCFFVLPTKANHSSSFTGFPICKNFTVAANNQVSSSSEEGLLASELLDDELLGQVSSAKDAAEVLLLIAEDRRRNGGVVSASDCGLIISAALDRGNAELALSVFSAMRSSFDSGWGGSAISVDRWKWSRPDVHTYTLLVKGLAASLRVADALKMIECVCRVGVSPGEEVPFGKVVRCPSCFIAVSVAQPQQGIQIVSCSKCRYQYELVSGNITTIESEEIS